VPSLKTLDSTKLTIAVIEEVGDVSQWLGETKKKPQMDQPQTGAIQSAIERGELPELEQQTVNGVPKPVFF
jgi:hypothetical protein